LISCISSEYCYIYPELSFKNAKIDHLSKYTVLQCTLITFNRRGFGLETLIPYYWQLISLLCDQINTMTAFIRVETYTVSVIHITWQFWYSWDA